MDASEPVPRAKPRWSPTTVGFWVAALLSLGVAGYGLAYLGPVQPPAPIAINGAGGVTLVIHATAAGIALALGPWQFVSKIRIRRRRLHRTVGRVYCLACLVGGVTGGALAVGTSSGPLAQMGFGLLAAGWLTCTALAWTSAITADFERHRMWMIRSFCLTFAAVTLRLYIPMSMAIGLEFGAAYPVIAWACWVPNLLVAEWLIRRQGALAIR